MQTGALDPWLMPSVCARSFAVLGNLEGTESCPGLALDLTVEPAVR